MIFLTEYRPTVGTTFVAGICVLNTHVACSLSRQFAGVVIDACKSCVLSSPLSSFFLHLSSTVVKCGGMPLPPWIDLFFH